MAHQHSVQFVLTHSLYFLYSRLVILSETKARKDSKMFNQTEDNRSFWYATFRLTRFILITFHHITVCSFTFCPNFISLPYISSPYNLSHLRFHLITSLRSTSIVIQKQAECKYFTVRLVNHRDLKDHHAFNNRVSVKHSSITKLVNCILREQSRSEILIERCRAGEQPKKKKRIYANLDARLRGIALSYNLNDTAEYLTPIAIILKINT